ncbi:Polyamine aminopropyltransferase [Candidatus Hepatincola sp. Av]
MKYWFEEKLYENDSKIGYKQSLQNVNTLVETTSNFQKITIFENPKFGKVLALDDVIQTTEADEFFYHEMFVHVPLFAHGKVKKVLIIGGGDGGILREVMRHESVKKAIMIEIDGLVVDLCKKEMPSLNNGAFLNKKADVKIDDGINFIKTTNEKFDVILVDSTDPINVGEVLFTDDFYFHAKRCLNSGGIFASQSGVPFLQEQELKGIHRKLYKNFHTVNFFMVPVPTYIGGVMCLSFATDDDSLTNVEENLITQRIKLSKISNLKYYNSKVHLAAFALPEFIKKIVA